MDAPHPLLKAHQRPWNVPVHQHVGALEVDAFVAGVRRDDHLESTRGKALAYFLAGRMSITPRVTLGGETVCAEAMNEPVGGVCELGEDNDLHPVAGQNAIGR